MKYNTKYAKLAYVMLCYVKTFLQLKIVCHLLIFNLLKVTNMFCSYFANVNIKSHFVNPFKRLCCHVFIIGDIKDIFLWWCPRPTVSCVPQLTVAKCVCAQNCNHLKKIGNVAKIICVIKSFVKPHLLLSD